MVLHASIFGVNRIYERDVSMDILLMVFYATLVLGLLVFIHEGGHYLASRLFGVRVTEFMLGLPGPSIGFTKGGTKFGVTPILLGGYAKVCGMEPGPLSDHLEPVLAALYTRGTANMEDIAQDCGISDDEAYEALEQLVEWGSILGPTKKDKYNTYRTPEYVPSKKEIHEALAAGKPAPQKRETGVPILVEDSHELYESEYHQQYRSLPFWKRSVILLAGIAVNLLFAMMLFIIIFSFIGVDMQHPTTGVMHHVVLAPLDAIQFGFSYIGMVVQMVASLFNPATAADTISNSTSIIGIAAMSKGAFDAGLVSALEFVAMISVSLGIMNLLPIPPLDGGRFVVEIFQKVSKKVVSAKVLNYLSVAGMVLFLGFFLVMANQDIQRFVFGNW